ncbi:MAG TPA: hypothetical protein VGH77_12750 [Streptosporangiaceae bacterium]
MSAGPAIPHLIDDSQIWPPRSPPALRGPARAELDLGYRVITAGR